MYVYDVQELAVWLSLPVRAENIRATGENLTCLVFKKNIPFKKKHRVKVGTSMGGGLRGGPPANPLVYHGDLPA